MIRQLELNPESRRNPRASLFRFPQSPLAPTKQEQYAWALDDYFNNVLENGMVFPSYVTDGYNKLAATNDLNEIERQEQAHQTYKIPIVNNVMESIRQDLEKKIQGDLKSAITKKRIGVEFPYVYGDAVEENLTRRYPLEKQLIEEYLRSRFGN